MKLREWIEANPDTLELYYYQFIIDSILALAIIVSMLKI